MFPYNVKYGRPLSQLNLQVLHEGKQNMAEYRFQIRNLLVIPNNSYSLLLLALGPIRDDFGLFLRSYKIKSWGPSVSNSH